MKVKGVAMVVDKVDRNGNLITKEAMELALKNFMGCPLGWEFNPNISPIGKVTKAALKGDKVEIEVEIPEKFQNKLGLAIVPSFTIKSMSIDKKTGGRIIKDLDLIDISLTIQPVDDGVTIFKARRKNEMGCISCDKTTCEYNKLMKGYGPEWGICHRGSGYDYGGGDIKINKFGHCISSKKKKKKK